MRTMIDLGSPRGPLLHIMDTPTSVDCGGRDVRFRRSFRSLVECVVPTCCGFPPPDSCDTTGATPTTTGGRGISTVMTGTFFGYRKGRVSFCLQDDTRSSPLLLLELGVPTSYLAREMQHGLLRIALESDRRQKEGCPLYGVPVWSMYCNGRKVGFATRRQIVSANDVLKLMRSVSVGAGVLPVVPKSEEEDAADLLYLRASFQRVIGSPDSESFHMINPDGNSGQELSIFLIRS